MTGRLHIAVGAQGADILPRGGLIVEREGGGHASRQDFGLDADLPQFLRFDLMLVQDRQGQACQQHGDRHGHGKARVQVFGEISLKTPLPLPMSRDSGVWS
jgi:hypothetical protein